MKGILILFIALIAVSAEPFDVQAELERIDAEIQANMFVDFVRGFLKGLNVKGNIENILKCAEGGEHVIEKIVIAIQFLIKIDIKHMDDIIKGLKMLLDAVMEIVKIIDPCSQTIPEIGKLVAAILGVNILRLAWSLITNALTFIKEIQDCIDAFNKLEFERAGKDIGHILFLLFLDNVEQSDSIIEFIKGLFKGLDEKGNIEDIIKCLDNIEPILNDIIKALELILTFELKKVYEGVIIFIAAVKKLFDIIKPCANSFEQLKKLMAAIANAKVLEIIKKIINNPGIFFSLITKAIGAFYKGDFFEFGHNVGLILHKLYLATLY